MEGYSDAIGQTVDQSDQPTNDEISISFANTTSSIDHSPSPWLHNTNSAVVSKQPDVATYRKDDFAKEESWTEHQDEEGDKDEETGSASTPIPMCTPFSVYHDSYGDSTTDEMSIDTATLPYELHPESSSEIQMTPSKSH